MSNNAKTAYAAKGTSHWTSRQASIIVPQRRADLDVQELDGEAVLFDRATGDTHKLNVTALHVWQRCDGRSTTREIAENLAECYQVDFESALDDVEQSLLGFAERQLIQGSVRIDRPRAAEPVFAR